MPFACIFAVMKIFDDVEDEEKVTLLFLKQSLSVYWVRRLINVIVVLIDSVIELTNQKYSMNNNLNRFYEEKIALSVHMSVIEEKLTVLHTAN